MSIRNKNLNRKLDEPLVKIIKTERRVKQDVKIYYLCNGLL